MSAFIGAVVVLVGLFIGVQLHSMKPFTYTLKSRRLAVPAQELRYRSEVIWVKTSDGKLVEVPQWQIDQMKVLQVLLVHQKGENSSNNPADAAMVTSQQLMLLQEALHKASNLEQFRQFYAALSKGQQKALLADAFTLEMQGLASLLITYMFPIEVQQQMGASVLQPVGIITPVVEYLQTKDTLPLSHTGPVYHIAFSPDGKRIISAAAGINNNLILYDLTTGQQESLLMGTTVVNDVAFSPDGKYIAIALFNTILLCDGYTGEKIEEFGKNLYWPDCITFSADSKYIILGSTTGSAQHKVEGNLVVYDIKKFNKVETFEYVEAPIHSVGCSPDGMYIIAGTAKDYVERVIVFDAVTGRWVKAFQGFITGKVCVGSNPDSSTIVAGGSQGGLVLWDIKTGKLLALLEGYDGGIRSVAFSFDGKYIASVQSGEQNNLMIWDGSTGKLVQNIVGMKNVRCVAFSPDGKFLLCGDNEELKLLKFITPQTIDYIARQLNFAQARFLYRLYIAKMNNMPVILDVKDLDYQIFKTLPADVQRVINAFLPFELASDFVEKEIQQKMKELKSSLFYTKGFFFGETEKTYQEKVKVIKDEMQKFDKNSVVYKACQRLLIELEKEVAFT